MARGERTLRVAELIQREVASTLVAEVRDPALRRVTVTGVRVSGDLRHARVLYTSGSAERSEVEVRLRRILPLVQRRVARNVSIRYVPRLEFRYDEDVAAEIRVGEILEEIRGGEAAVAEAGDGAGGGGEDGGA